jgi:LysM repeat protein
MLARGPHAGTTKCQVYTARNGDYGELIASEFGVNLSELQALNPKVSGSVAAAWTGAPVPGRP